MSKSTNEQIPVAAKPLSPSPGILQRKCGCGNHTMAGGECSECSKSEKTLQRATRNSEGESQNSSGVPPIVNDVLRSPGQPLDPATQAFMEPRFGRDFSQVRVHTDGQAAESARSVNALAYTAGPHVVFGPGQYQPQTSEGQHVLAHELVHTQQQGVATPTELRLGKQNDPAELEANTVANAVGHDRGSGPSSPLAISGTTSSHAAGILQRTPAPPEYKGVTGVFDRSKVVISDLPDLTVDTTKIPPQVPSQVATATFTDPAIVHLSWELYGPADNILNGQSSFPNSPNALTFSFQIDKMFKTPITQGRHIVRCIGRNAAHAPAAYADQSFFVSTARPLSQKSLGDLKAIKAAPASHSLGEVGGATARSMMLEHQAAVAATGTGTIQGNECAAPKAGVAQSDCTNYVLDVLKIAFAAKGKSADWNTVFAEAQKTSAGKFKGSELLKALVSKAGWKGVFWSPDPRNPGDHASEHSVVYKRATEEGQYRTVNEKTGVPVDAAKSVIDYRPTSPTKQESKTNLDRLKDVPLAVIAARGGKHMTLLVGGQVYEVHWDKPATDPNVIEATPLEKWKWNSGVLVMPAEDYARTF